MNNDIKCEKFLEAIRHKLYKITEQFEKKSRGILLVDKEFDLEELTDVNVCQHNWYWMKNVFIYNQKRANEVEKLLEVTEVEGSPAWGVCYQIMVPANQIKAWLKYKPEAIEALGHDGKRFGDVENYYVFKYYVFRNLHLVLQAVKRLNGKTDIEPLLVFTDCFGKPFLYKGMGNLINSCVYRVRKFAEEYKRLMQEVYDPLAAMPDAGKSPEIINVLQQLNESHAA